MSNIRFAKHNMVRFSSSENREIGTRMFSEFFESIKSEEQNGMKGHVVLNSMEDPQEAIVLTFWERKDEMDRFYSSRNSSLASLVDRAKPLFEKMPLRTDYVIADLSLSPQ